MRRLTVLAMAAAMALLAEPAAAACAREDFAHTVDRAGAALRQINAENAPRLRAKMRQLKDARGWSDADFEAKAYEALQDERLAALDAQANDLLARLDQLGTVEPGAEPDCAKLQELMAASLELQATVKTKAAYTLSKLDQMLGVAAGGPALAPKAPAPEARGPAPEAKAPAPEAKGPAARSAAPRQAPAAPPSPPKAAPRPPEGSGWSTRTTGEPSREVAIAQPPAPPAAMPPPPPPAAPPEEESYSIEEIKAASEGFFGKVSASLGAVIEHIFKNSGRPTGYILGTEGGGAFLAGVRYGNGTLYMRSGETQPIFWHGPSIGTDVGAEGSKTLFLIYRLRTPQELYASFTGIDGSAYLVGGVGATLVTNGKVILAPIRSGVGLRLGANIGYIRFTPRATWNPF